MYNNYCLPLQKGLTQNRWFDNCNKLQNDVRQSFYTLQVNSSLSHTFTLNLQILLYENVYVESLKCD